MMKCVIFGSQGQLGRELCLTHPSTIEISGYDIDEVDVRDLESVREILLLVRPEVVVNAAAYTGVDKAETEREEASRVNVGGAENVARASAEIGSFLVQLSTDFVFNGRSGRPYQPGDQADPINHYGQTKWEAEKRVCRLLGERALIIRTAWLYSVFGSNFVKTILRLLGERSEVRVVDDQIGTPTWARGLARSIWSLVQLDSLASVCHWTDAGVASWYDLAVAVREEALSLKIMGQAATVVPVSSSEYHSPARRPPFSVLDKRGTWEALGQKAPHWRESLRLMLAEIAEQDSLSREG